MPVTNPMQSNRTSSEPLPRHFSSFPTLQLSPIREASSREELYASYDEAMTPLTFLPDVDLVPMTPASKEVLNRPGAPFALISSAEDLAFLSGASVHSSVSSMQDDSSVESTDSKGGGLVWRVLNTVMSILGKDGSSGSTVEEGNGDFWAAHACYEEEERWNNSWENEALSLPFGRNLAIGPTEPLRMWD